MVGDGSKIKLLEILADVLCLRMIRCMRVNCHRPVVCGPDHARACGGSSGGESASTGEQINGDHFKKGKALESQRGVTVGLRVEERDSEGGVDLLLRLPVQAPA